MQHVSSVDLTSEADWPSLVVWREREREGENTKEKHVGMDTVELSGTM